MVGATVCVYALTFVCRSRKAFAYSVVPALLTTIGVTSLWRSNERDAFISSKLSGMPYFEDKRSLINLDNAFFFLDDNRGFVPSLLHHGLFVKKAFYSPAVGCSVEHLPPASASKLKPTPPPTPA